MSLGTGIEWGLLGLTAVFGGLFLRSGLRRSEEFFPALLIVGGILLWSASLLQLFDPFPEEASTPLAALLAACGLIWTARVQEKTRPKSKEAT